MPMIWRLDPGLRRRFEWLLPVLPELPNPPQKRPGPTETLPQLPELRRHNGRVTRFSLVPRTCLLVGHLRLGQGRAPVLPSGDVLFQCEPYRDREDDRD